MSSFHCLEESCCACINAFWTEMLFSSLTSFGKVFRWYILHLLINRTLRGSAKRKRSGVSALHHNRTTYILSTFFLHYVWIHDVLIYQARLWYVQCLRLVCVSFLLCAPMPVCLWGLLPCQHVGHVENEQLWALMFLMPLSGGGVVRGPRPEPLQPQPCWPF